MENKTKEAFTLVELIIVITILSILATISFMSFQWYASESRDSSRVSTLKNIETWLNIFQTKSGKYPQPDGWILITASGNTIWYQWFVWDGVTRGINMNAIPLDPKDNEKYIYSTNIETTKYQLLTLLEWESSLVWYLPNVYAWNLTDRVPKTIGDEIGILLNEDNSFPTGTWVDVVSTSKTYKAILKNTLSGAVVGSGTVLSFLKDGWGKSCLEILQKNPTKKNKDGVYQINPDGKQSLQVYCDMTNEDGGWTLAVVNNGWDTASIKTIEPLWDVSNTGATFAKISQSALNTLTSKKQLLFEDSTKTKRLFTYDSNTIYDFVNYKSYRVKLKQCGTSIESPRYSTHPHFILFVGITDNLTKKTPCISSPDYDRISYWSFDTTLGRYKGMCEDNFESWNPYLYWAWNPPFPHASYKIWVR